MHAVSPIQVTDTLHYNDKEFYMKYPYIGSNMDSLYIPLYDGQYLLETDI